MGCQQPLRPSADRTPTVVHRVQCACQVQRETMIGGEPVGGELTLPTDRSVDRGTEHHRQSDEGQRSADRPLTLLQGMDHGHGHPGDHDDGQSGPGLAPLRRSSSLGIAPPLLYLSLVSDEAGLPPGTRCRVEELGGEFRARTVLGRR